MNILLTPRIHDSLRVKQSLQVCNPLILKSSLAASSRYRSDRYVSDIFHFDVLKHDFFYCVTANLKQPRT
jgi:hypothetical protein